MNPTIRNPWTSKWTSTFALLALSAGPVLARSAPQSDELSEADILLAVDRELYLDSAVPSHGVDVELQDGILTLTGEVDDLRAKRRAARIAETVKGVCAVVNRISVAPTEGLTDERILADVESALLHDPAADSLEVAVSVTDGHVTLRGAVDSWQERELCTAVAEGVEGVRELKNELIVSATLHRPAAEIRSEIEGALRWDVLVDDGLIDVDVDDAGNVTLSGTTGSAAEKRRARMDARVAGVTSIDDEALEVARWARDEDLRAGKYAHRSAQEIRQALEAAMALDPRVASFDVDPVVQNGVVTLQGVVDNVKAKRAAESDARHTVGVISVRNHLKVRPEQKRSNAEVEGDIRAALLRDPDVNRYDIAVDADKGTAYLFGTVDSQFEKAQADDLTARVDGVTEVVNCLDVHDGPYAHDPYVDRWYIHGFPWYGYVPSYAASDDWEVQRDIESQLFWSPFVDSDEITVEVDDGVATLEGTVDSWSERGAARDNAYEGGATYVRNDLEVEATVEPNQ